MNWCHDPVLTILRYDPPAKKVRWEALSGALERLGYRMVETDGFHLSIEHGGRMARFHHAVGIARGYQLAALRAFLEGRP